MTAALMHSRPYSYRNISVFSWSENCPSVNDDVLISGLHRPTVPR